MEANWIIISDLILRGMAIGAMVATALVLISRSRSRGTSSVAALGLCTVCYLLISAPTIMPNALQPLLIAGATLLPLALTWMATVQLTDDASQRRPVLVLALLTVVTAALIPFWPAMTLIRGILAIALYLGLIILALATDSDDLVIDRRRFRRGFLVAMGALGLIVSVVEASGLDANLPNWIYPLQASAILVMALLFAIWALEPVAGEPIKRTGFKSRADLTERVEQAMRRGIWQREGLTIGAFAEELGVPEHQLRATINGEMGHRNFSTFINVARIKAAKALMDDPSRGRTTILEIAHEVGFASLGPFNKAFRAQTGSSPREYRNRS